MSEVAHTPSRKADHIRVNLEQDVRSGLSTGLERLHFTHRALPDLNLDDVDAGCAFLGKPLAAPLLISSMTGGTEQATRINMMLAEAAQSARIAIGLGSQRVALEDPHWEASFRVRSVAPDALLFANLGAVQLNYGYGITECSRAVEMASADALFLHLNPLQEAVVPEGNTRFAGLLPRIEAVCRALPVPVIVKEVGWGISADDARRLVDAGVAAIDVAGAGGTSWTQVEMHRASSRDQAELAAAFLDWGIPTATALRDIHQALPAIPLIASGGLQNGVDLAKCITLGASLGGMAGPFLRSAAESPQAIHDRIRLTIAQLRVAMFAAGCATLDTLRQAKLWADG
ncbi:MAG: type 2 isopentenyl-diphosphate Delta-isomerase [Chloroflexi bacterium]|nr:type 2 isopentenyl-diphosphate Delta-isomerase [Chloroflexota bacterium]